METHENLYHGLNPEEKKSWMKDEKKTRDGFRRSSFMQVVESKTKSGKTPFVSPKEGNEDFKNSELKINVLERV